MRIGVMAGARESLVTTTLVAALRAIGHAPEVVFRQQPKTGKGRAKAALREFGPARAARDAIRGGAAVDVASEVGRRAFAAFAERHELSEWDGSLSAACAAAGAEVVGVPGVNAPETIAAVKERQLDLLLNLVPSIYRDAILDAPRIGVLNPHMGPLPEIRGMNAAEWSCFHGLKACVSMHFIEKGIDTGGLLLQNPLPVEDAESFQVVRGRSGPVFVQCFLDAVAGLADGSLEPHPQDPGGGRQYYVMHPRVLAITERRLAAWAAAQA